MLCQTRRLLQISKVQINGVMNVRPYFNKLFHEELQTTFQNDADVLIRSSREKLLLKSYQHNWIGESSYLSGLMKDLSSEIGLLITPMRC